MAEHFRLKEKEVVRELLKRERRKQRKLEAGLLPRYNGRPRKATAPRDLAAEQAYEIKLYWHILDPATGYPVRSNLQAVTIIGTEGKLFNALSTALFVMGADKAEDYWRENGGFAMLLLPMITRSF